MNNENIKDIIDDLVEDWNDACDLIESGEVDIDYSDWIISKLAELHLKINSLCNFLKIEIEEIKYDNEEKKPKYDVEKWIKEAEENN